MSVVVEGDRITVHPPDVDVNDFLEYAEVAIQRYGWRQGPQQKGGSNLLEVAERDGLSLHDAVGFTNEMLGGREQGKPTGKDTATTSRTGAQRSMRNEMNQAIAKHLPKGKDDRTFNDEAKTEDEVLAVLRAARGVAVA